MININNYQSQVSSINWTTMPEALAKGHNLVLGASQNNWAMYHTNENIKRVIDAYFEKLSGYLAANSSTAKSKPTKEKPSPKSKTAPSAAPAKGKILNYKGLRVEIRKASADSKKFIVWDVATDQIFANEKFDSVSQAKSFIEENEMILVSIKANEEEESAEAEQVELIDSDVAFIKRYAAMHGKVKSQAQVLTLIHSLQKAILEKRIGKDSAYAKEIELMQKQLISCYEKMGEMAEIKIDSKNLKRYLEIAGSQEGMLSIALLKAFVALNGKAGVKEKSEKLFARIKKSVDQGKITRQDKYADKLNEAFVTLKSFIEGESKMLSIAKAQLNGLMGIVGENLFAQKKSLNGTENETGIVVNSEDLLKMEFETIGLQGKYRQLIGDPSVGFTAMVYGLPKSGKSTLCLDFANYLAAHHGKVLFCAIEEGFGYTLKEKIERLKADHPNLFLTDRVPENLGDYHFVFIDSVSKAGMDITEIDRLHKSFPEVSFIFIYHTTKEGKFKGVNTHAHEVDVIIQVDKGVASSTGRFSAGGRLEL
ncbi:MAG: hypothetical protein CFE21_10865 [Bacteroidetes bacterium B1(2017)]|nr:MAG: hypothetical protein CFE21_10865 [Bacteroidetes bacterium B1(2017)]